MEGKLIFSKIPAIMANIDHIGKDRKNQSQGYNFRGIDDCYNMLHKYFAAHQVFYTSTVLEQIREERASKQGTAMIYAVLTVKFTFYAEDGSSVDSVTVGEAMDSGDKASNKAMSTALKYALMQLFLIPTEEDKDTETASPEVKLKAANSKKQSKDIDAAVENYVDPPAKTEVIPATVNQKTQILLLLNVKCIKADEKQKMVDKLATMSTTLADSAIARLKAIIKERGVETGEMASGKQVAFIEEMLSSSVFLDEERNPILDSIKTGKYLKSDAMAAIDWIESELKSRKVTAKAAA